jgi:octaprenyl-diphosphate synthase
MIRSVISQGGTEDQLRIRQVVESTGGLDYTARLAEDEASRAIEVLAEIPASAFRDGLAALAKYAVSRSA